VSNGRQSWLLRLNFLLAVWLFLGGAGAIGSLGYPGLFSFVFLNTALWAVAGEQESCGCFGRRYPFVLGSRSRLILSQSQASYFAHRFPGTSAAGGLTPRHRIVLSATVGIIGLVLVYPYLTLPQIESKSSLGVVAEPVGVDSGGLAQVIEALEKNRAALKTLLSPPRRRAPNTRLPLRHDTWLVRKK